MESLDFLSIMSGAVAGGVIAAVVAAVGGRKNPVAALAARLVSLEQAMPTWQVAMAQLEEECRDLLSRSERKRARASADVSVARRLRGEDGELAEQPELVEAEPRTRRQSMKLDIERRLRQRGWSG